MAGLVYDSTEGNRMDAFIKLQEKKANEDFQAQTGNRVGQTAIVVMGVLAFLAAVWIFKTNKK